MSDFDTSSYWESRYAEGGNSGTGSYGMLAENKAAVINDFVARASITSVTEWGCGDGNQLRYAKYPFYLGLDISQTAIDACKKLFWGDQSKRFLHISEFDGSIADLSLSLDVLYHLIEDSLFERYIHDLFNSSRRWVIIYADNTDLIQNISHVRVRKFTDFIDSEFRDWRLHSIVFNKFKGRFAEYFGGGVYSPSDFYIYERVR